MPEIDPLAGLWAHTEAPARDLAFELAVEEAIARRRLVWDAARLAGAAAVAVVIVWLAGPGLAGVVSDLALPFAQAGPVIVVSLAMAGLALWLAQTAPDPER